MPFRVPEIHQVQFYDDQVFPLELLNAIVATLPPWEIECFALTIKPFQADAFHHSGVAGETGFRTVHDQKDKRLQLEIWTRFTFEDPCEVIEAMISAIIEAHQSVPRAWKWAFHEALMFQFPVGDWRDWGRVYALHLQYEHDVDPLTAQKMALFFTTYLKSLDEAYSPCQHAEVRRKHIETFFKAYRLSRLNHMIADIENTDLRTIVQHALSESAIRQREGEHEPIEMFLREVRRYLDEGGELRNMFRHLHDADAWLRRLPEAERRELRVRAVHAALSS